MDHEDKTYLLTLGSPEDRDRSTFTFTAIITKVVDILINYDHNNFVFAGSALLFYSTFLQFSFSPKDFIIN